MKNTVRFWALFVLSLVFVVNLTSCDFSLGLGEVVDTTPPQITIDNPGEYVPKDFNLTGTYSDDQGLVSISVEYTYKESENAEMEKRTAEAELGPNKKEGNWSCLLSFPCDQEVTITVKAHDSQNNEDVYSSDYIAVVIDSESPKTGILGITRDSGFTTTTIPLARFLGENGKTAQKNNSANKDSFQNETILITGNITEGYEIGSVTLDLYELSDVISDTIYTKTLIKENIPVNPDCNIYNPEFTITQELLESCNPNLKTGLHYIWPIIRIKDGAGNENEIQENKPYVFAWDNASDKPVIKASSIRDSEGKIRIPQETDISITIFDDDGLASYEWTLYSVDINGNQTEARKGSKDISDSNLRDHNFEVITGKKAPYDSVPVLSDGNYKLVVKVTDQNKEVEGRTSKTTVYEEAVKITNSDAATLTITAPEYNSIPALTGANNDTFTVTGEAFDNQPLTHVAIAWLRKNDSETIDKVQKYFEKYDFSSTIDEQDYRIWNVGIQGSPTKIGQTYKSNFQKSFNIYSDFCKYGTNEIVNAQKILIVAAKDSTDNITTEILRLAAYDSLPTFKIETSENGTNWTTQNQIAISTYPEQDLYVRITPKGTLPIIYFSGNQDNTLNADWTNNIASGKTFHFLNPASDLKSVISYKARDIFNNEGEGTFTIQFDKIPEITDIRCNQAGETLRKDNTITIQVTFDKGVTVTPAAGKLPYIELTPYKGDTALPIIKAEYRDAVASSTVFFDYTIPEGKEYTKLAIKKDGSNWINLNGGTITRGQMTAQIDSSLTISDFGINVDSKTPALTGLSGQRSGTTANYSRNADGSINIILNFDEPVTAQNGNITIYRKGSEDITEGDHTWHIPAVISAEVFEKIWNNSTAENRIILSSSSTEKSVFGKDIYGKQGIVSKGPYKMYTNGLKLNEKPIYQYAAIDGSALKSSTVINAANSVMVPDLTTKYVLDYDYDTDGTAKPAKKSWETAAEYAAKPSTADLRAALEAVNYHKTTISLSRLVHPTTGGTVDESKYVLTLKDSDFIDGIRDGVEFIMVIPERAFADKVQNLNGTIANRVFTVGKVAKPVIRVNRWSTNSTTDLDPYHASTDNDYLKTGVKIDCETPGATITYQVTNLSVTSDYSNATENIQKSITPPDIMPDAVGSDAVAANTKTPTFNNVGITTGTQYNGDKASYSFDKSNYSYSVEQATTGRAFNVGTKNTNVAERIYIGANASLPSSELQKSEDVYEGAFKTVLHYTRMRRSDNDSYPYGNFTGTFKIHACQTPEGVSYVAGWPLTMRLHFHTSNTINGYEDCYKNAVCTNVADSNDTNNPNNGYMWVSWELVSDDLFTVTTVSWNFQKVINTLTSYGSYAWGYSLPTW